MKLKYIISMVIIFLFCCNLANSPVHAQESIQALIDRASPGDEIIVPEGVYEETLLITKPLTLIGENVTLKNLGDDVTIHIQSNHVTLTDFTLIEENLNSNSTGLLIEGNENIVKHLKIHNYGIGVMLNGASRNFVEHVQVQRDAPIPLADTTMGNRQGNGIDLYNSNDNVLHNNTMIHMLDGVYLENSHGNIVEYNNSIRSRYGYHIMFANNTTMNNNSASENITGAMVMGTKGTTITHNNFSKQSYHVHSQGLLLYDVHDSTVQGNTFSENLIGLYLERSSNNLIKENKVIANFVGMQLKLVESNEITFNDFSTNVIQTRVTDSSNNNVKENYWDTHSGLDFTGDGKSELAFHSDPIFLALVEKKPPYQLLSQSPGLLFLDLLLDINDKEVLKDPTPLMEPHNNQIKFFENHSAYDVYLYSFMVLFSVSIIIGGLRK